MSQRFDLLVHVGAPAPCEGLFQGPESRCRRRGDFDAVDAATGEVLHVLCEVCAAPYQKADPGPFELDWSA